jgi:acetylornithine deacetylase/succinyl-diaminopimelate desuccinylase-like protein
MQPTLTSLKSWYDAHAASILDDYLTFLSFPSISTDKAFSQDTRKTADWLAAYLRKIGLSVELWETSGYPVIFGSHLKAGKERPTVLIYGHYDVQPVDPLDLWKSDPFKPVIIDNIVYARGASDNKGQCFYSVQAIRAFLELAQNVGVNIKVFIEGEEESGGKGTGEALEKKKAELKADHLLAVDMDIPRAGQPGVTVGMRGIVTMEVVCQNSSTDLHSGTHGGIALNPNRALVSALAKLWDDQGRVAVSGFYDAVEPLSKEDLAKLDQNFDLERYQQEFGVKSFANEKGCSLLEANWTRPTLEINGIVGGYTGAGFKTVIPAKASAKISCRLVPHQQPEKIAEAVAAFLRLHLPEEMQLDVHIYHGAPAYRGNFNAQIVQIAQKAFEEVFSKPCSYLLAGGSVPIVGDLVKATGAEAVLMGVALPGDNIHAPNEHFGMDRFEQGFLTIGRILAMLST